MDIKEKKGAEIDITKNFWHRCGIVCVFHCLTEGVLQSKWTRLLQIANEIVRDWSDRKSGSNLFMEQNLKYECSKGRQQLCRLKKE